MLVDILSARERLGAHLNPTPLEPAPGLGERTWLKLENANRTHSFKVRGALNALLALDREALAGGIIVASSGNHAQGIAYAASKLGVNARIYMPASAPRKKVAGVRMWGIEPILHGTYDEAEAEAMRQVRETGIPYISPYNHPLVAAGQGTIGLEILDSLPDVARVIVPVGGGGLISGIAAALKESKPSVQVIGVCTAASPDMINEIQGTAHPLSYDTLADALPGPVEPGSITLDLTRRYVDELVMVSEDAIARAMRWMLSDAGWMAEGGGVVGLAALLDGVIPADDPRGETVVVISGGNVDVGVLRRVLAEG